MIFIGSKKDCFRPGSVIRAVFYAVALLSLFSCGMNAENRKEPDHTVLVLHSYNDMGQEGSYFRSYMEGRFRHYGMNVRIHHIYLDLIHKELPFTDENGKDCFIDTVRRYNPDILLMNANINIFTILQKILQNHQFSFLKSYKQKARPSGRAFIVIGCSAYQ